MILTEARTWGSQELKDSNDTASLDAELLLAEALQVCRAHLIAHGERPLTSGEQERYQSFIARRKQSEPVAYITGHKEFWSLDFQVTPATLVPRPETELLVELLLRFFPQTEQALRIADLGTGCGAIAVALGHERPAWEIYATDRSAAALEIAAQNAARLGLKNLRFCHGSWYEALPPLRFDAVVSNPPYLSEQEWSQAPKDLSFEPRSALVAEKEGLRDLEEIIRGAKASLRPGGYLLLEHGATQAAAVRKILEKEGYLESASYHDLAGIERVSGGRCTR